MSREIKFRAWDKKAKEMIDNILIYKNEVYKNTEPVDSFPLDAELMQYTGMSDKNRTAIYDKDIVKDEETGKVFEVFWNNIGTGCWWFATRDKDGFRCHTRCIDLDNLVVIGNLLENPELLEQK